MTNLHGALTLLIAKSVAVDLQCVAIGKHSLLSVRFRFSEEQTMMSTNVTLMLVFSVERLCHYKSALLKT